MNTRALALLGLALATAGCVDAKPNLYVAGICGSPSDPTACKAPAGKCDNFQNGTLFLWARVQKLVNGVPGVLANELLVVAEIQNLSPSNADDSIGRVNGRNAIIEKATIDYASAGLSLPSAVVDRLFTPVPSAGSATIFLPVLPSAQATVLSGLLPAGSNTLLLADVTLTGHYTDGSSFDTGPFQVPLQFVNATFDSTLPCTDPTKVRVFCYGAGQTGQEACVTP